MFKMTQGILEALKIRTPFVDRYVIDKAKKEDKKEVIIDRVYTEQKYHVFSLILRDSTPETFAANLLTPDKWIDPTRQAVKSRKKAEKKNSMHEMAVTDHRTEAAITITHANTIRKALKEAHRILFETDDDELPLLSSIEGWQYLVSIRYEALADGEIEAPTKTLLAAPEEAKLKKE